MRTLTFSMLFLTTLSYAAEHTYRRPPARPDTANISCESHGSWAFVTDKKKEEKVVTAPEPIPETTSSENSSDSASATDYAGDSDSGSVRSTHKKETSASEYDTRVATAALFAPDRPKPKRCCGCCFWR